MTEGISKLEGARRQLETAIDLFFDNKDSLSVHTLAWAAFKVLFDIYPHHSQDGFAAQMDALLGKEGWQAMSGVANFLKHADRDPDAFLASHHPMQGMALIGLATLLYKRAAGDLTLKMMALDYWAEELGYEELGIAEVDENAERVAAFKAMREKIRELPFERQIEIGRLHYQRFQELHGPISALLDRAKAEGLTITQVLDRYASVKKVD